MERIGWPMAVDRRTLERAVAPASLYVTLRSLHRNKILRNYRITTDRVFLDADRVALEIVVGRMAETA